MNIADMRDLALEAQQDVAELFAQAQAEWFEPDLKLQLAVAAQAMTQHMPEAWANVPPEVKKQLLEVFNA